MNTFIAYTPIVVGSWLIFLSMLMHTKNLYSAMIFKIIPFTLGVLSLIVGLKLTEII